MTKAEEAASRAYPVVWKKRPCDGIVRSTGDYEDINLTRRIGFQQGYEKAEKELGWISVKDRLPEKDGWYFTCVEMSGVPQCVGLSHFETYSGQWDDDDDSVELVDYWMEIPALPKKEENTAMVKDKINSL